MGHGHQICKAELEKYVNQFQTVLKDSNDPVIARLRDLETCYNFMTAITVVTELAR